MSLHQPSLQGTRTPVLVTPQASNTQVHGRRLVLMRLGWTLLTLYNLVIFVVSIPTYYAVLLTTYADPRQERISGQLTPGNVRALHQLGISLSTYAAATLAISIGASSIFLIMGLVLFWRKSDDWMAVLASSVLMILAGVGDVRYRPEAPVFIVLATLVYGIGGCCGLGLFLSLFPTGRPIKRWAWLLVVLWVVQLIPFVQPPDSPHNIRNWPPLLFAGEQLVLWGTSMGVQLYRYTRVSDQVQRQQCKWLIFGFALALLIDIPYYGLQGLVPILAAPDAPYLLLQATVSECFRVFVPLGIGVAILRYRLWDIDLLINRTLVYGALTASVVGCYILVVGYLGALLRTGGNLLISLFATGVVAVLFQPVRGWLQRGVNRLMYGQRDEPYAVVARLGRRLESTLAPEAVLSAIVETVAQALKLPYAAITLKQGDAFQIAAVYGSPVEGPLALPLTYQAESVGQLVLGPRKPGEAFTPADRKLLDDLARQIGIAAHAVRLTSDLQRSRERLVTAREEERRRLRRDLHDGLGPTLAALALKTTTVSDLIPTDPAAATRLSNELYAEIRATVGEIRRLVYALRPPRLDELGLIGAIREVARQQSRPDSLQITVEAPERLPALPAAVEVAAYRIIQEALTNVARHAQAHLCTVRLSLADSLQVEIRDDGVGIKPAHHSGVGLLSMRERARELGGTCLIECTAGGGTRVSARLPIPSQPQEEANGAALRAAC